MSFDENPSENKSNEKDETWPAVPQAKSQEKTHPSRSRQISQRMQDKIAQEKEARLETTETQKVVTEPEPVEADKRASKLIPVINRQTETVVLAEDTLDDDDISTQPIVNTKSMSQHTGKGIQKPIDEPPWTLQQFFNGEIDLDVELAKRFPSMPMMTSIKFRTLGAKTGRKVATLQTQDGSASVIIDADPTSKNVQISFTFGSMITLRFALSDLNDVDRKRWLELMRRQQGGLAFLWGTNRWSSDYMICITRKYHSNMYAFSPNNFESAVRMTSDVANKLLDWLDEFWSAEEPSDDEPPQLLTW